MIQLPAPAVFAVALPFLNEMVLLFLASVLIAYVCYRLRLVPIAGFLLAGIIVGPNSLGLVYDQALVDMLAEIGVILLLFTNAWAWCMIRHWWTCWLKLGSSCCCSPMPGPGV